MLFWSLLTLLSCGDPAGPFAKEDERYTQIMVQLGAADRDNARNVRNKEARQRKIDAEKEKIAFFSGRALQTLIDEARNAEAGSLEKIKGDAYYSHMIQSRSWTQEEKTQETKLLGELEEAASQEAFWKSADGSVEANLGYSWTNTSKAADELDEAARADLYNQYINHRMSVVDRNLQDLVNLRNKVAEREGYKNYWELSLAASGLTVAEVEQLIADLTPVIEPINKHYLNELTTASQTTGLALTRANIPVLRRSGGPDSVNEEADNYFDTDLAEERVTTAFQDLGIPTDSWQVHTEPRRHARPGAYSFPIRPPTAVAIVLSQDNRWSTWDYEALAHEGAHGVWWTWLSKESVSSPVLWSPPDPWFEGYAGFFERMIMEPGFMARYVPEVPSDRREKLHQNRARGVSSSITNNIIATMVERRLYEDPSNLEAVTRYAAELRSKYTGLPMAPKTEKGLHYDRALLSRLSWNYPGYNQNFVFASMVEAWLFAAVKANVGDPIANSKVGPFLRDKLVRAPLDSTFTERLSALMPGNRVAPLKSYLEMATLTEAKPAAQPPGDTPEPAKPE